MMYKFSGMKFEFMKKMKGQVNDDGQVTNNIYYTIGRSMNRIFNFTWLRPGN